MLSLDLIDSMEAANSLNSYEWQQLRELIKKDRATIKRLSTEKQSLKKTIRNKDEKIEYYKKRLDLLR
jgi:predicted RNase H-like nuclease (RuvC/YqgF family)